MSPTFEGDSFLCLLQLLTDGLLWECEQLSSLCRVTAHMTAGLFWWSVLHVLQEAEGTGSCCLGTSGALVGHLEREVSSRAGFAQVEFFLVKIFQKAVNYDKIGVLLSQRWLFNSQNSTSMEKTVDS